MTLLVHAGNTASTDATAANRARLRTIGRGIASQPTTRVARYTRSSAMPDDEVLQMARARIGRVLLGKYRIERVLGVGGMATVYLANHRNNKQFAVKMLHPEVSQREHLRTRFLREGYVANSVKHAGAVAVLDDD